jgi:negative regulator of flagellin synthesis FlgM
MKVSNQSPLQSQVIEKSKEAGTPPKVSSELSRSESTQGQSGAAVEISERAQLMKQAMDIARNSPDVRKDKIESLKKSIKEGTYQVESSKIADRLVDDHLRSDFGKNLL